MRRRRVEPAPSTVPVLSTGDQGAIAIARSLLDSAGIAYWLVNDRVADLFGWGRLGGSNLIVGAVEIRVSREDEDAARQLLAEVQVSRQRIPRWLRIAFLVLFLLLPLAVLIIQEVR